MHGGLVYAAANTNLCRVERPSKLALQFRCVSYVGRSLDRVSDLGFIKPVET